jgi:hypothetical protein
VINLLLSLHFMALILAIKLQFAQVRTLPLKNEQQKQQFINRHLPLSPHLRSYFLHSSSIRFHPLMPMLFDSNFSQTTPQ